jgi:hypothetical protein
MKTSRFQLDVQAAVNGWVIYAAADSFNPGQLLPPAWVCADDASLAETIAAALVSLRLDAANGASQQEKLQAAVRPMSVYGTDYAQQAIDAYLGKADATAKQNEDMRNAVEQVRCK